MKVELLNEDQIRQIDNESEEEYYTIELKHEDIRREVENYINHAKALGIKIGGSYGDAPAYAQLVATVCQVEHNNGIRYRSPRTK